MNSCDECGFDYPSTGVSALPEVLGGFAVRYAKALADSADVRRRPAPGVWSPLEYTCHVRDVFRVQRERLDLALRVDSPPFVAMGREERVVADQYNAQVPWVVLADLATAADQLGAALAGLGPAELARTGVYPWPAPEARSLLWLGRHSVHEGHHHLMDIRRAG